MKIELEKYKMFLKPSTKKKAECDWLFFDFRYRTLTAPNHSIQGMINLA